MPGSVFIGTECTTPVDKPERRTLQGYCRGKTGPSGGAETHVSEKSKGRGWRFGTARKAGWLGLAVAWLLVPAAARAQDQFSRWEAGAQFSTFRLLNNSGPVGTLNGFGARVDFNLTRRLALEAQFDFFPGKAPSFFLEEGGRTWTGLFGIRAKAIQTRRFAAFGLVRPGFVHFTDVALPTDTAPFFRIAPATYFAVNLGGGLEFYPRRRWIVRFEVEGDPYRIPNFHTATATGSGKINDAWRLSAGIGYRLGRMDENAAEKPVAGRVEFGPQLTAVAIGREGPGEGVRTEPGLGGYLSYRVAGFLYLDSAASFLLRDTKTSGPHDGGRIFEGLVGLKAGIRRERMGLFLKARPGVASYSRALQSITETSPPPAQAFAFGYERSAALLLDLGGVVELYPARRNTLRFDLGDTHIYWGTRRVTQADGSVSVAPGGAYRHSIQFAVGYGWRF